MTHWGHHEKLITKYNANNTYESNDHISKPSMFNNDSSIFFSLDGQTDPRSALAREGGCDGPICLDPIELPKSGDDLMRIKLNQEHNKKVDDDRFDAKDDMYIVE